MPLHRSLAPGVARSLRRKAPAGRASRGARPSGTITFVARYLPTAVVLVLFFSILIAGTTQLTFWLPLGVLSFNWIGAPLIGRQFEKRNPSLSVDPHEPEPFAWKIFGRWMTVFALVGWFVSWKSDLPYFTAFAYVLLIGTSAIAVNAIIIDWEDNQKGGWLNP